jgi:hypothetical protein
MQQSQNRAHRDRRASPAAGCRSLRLPSPPREIEWEELLGQLDVDLEETARATKAVQRQRKFTTAATLLRACLLYALDDWLLSQVAAQLAAAGLVDVSAVDLFQRLSHCTAWLGTLLAALLRPQRLAPRAGEVRVRLVDASVVSRPGSTGTDFRLHLGWDLGASCCTGVEVTDAHGGETLVRHAPQPGEITVADRGYGHRRGLGALVSGGGRLVVRFSPQNLPLGQQDGTRVALLAWLRQVPGTGVGEMAVWVETPAGTIPLRLVARRLSPEATEKARRRLRQAARKKGHTPDQACLEAAGFILLLSELASDQWSAEQILELYRWRWQVELVFKRLKGIVTLDHLRAQGADLAQTYLLGKMLGVLLVERLSNPTGPLTADWFADIDRPVSLTAWLRGWAEVVWTAVRPVVTLAQWTAALPRLRRHLCARPRKRRQPAALARHVLSWRTPLVHPSAPLPSSLVLTYA